jgi:hypothetical protein
MNKDINRTLTALVPILRMNGEMVKSIEAVNDWYKVGDREYLKEVAEITYDNGTRRYADIGCDSNLTAVFDVVAVIQQIKPRSSAIERIERGVYRQYPIENIPAADVKPVVRGKWLRGKESATSPAQDSYTCSVCWDKALASFWGKPARTNYCPHCGADMREGSAVQEQFNSEGTTRKEQEHNG